MRTTYACAAIAIALLFEPVAQAIQVRASPAALPSKDRAALEHIACWKPHDVRSQEIQGYAAGDADDVATDATIGCRSHGQFMGKPMRYIANCRREDNAWSCADQLEILVPVGTRDVPVRPAGNITPELAYETIRKIGAAGWLWFSLKFMARLGVTSAEIQTIVWFAMTIIGVVIFSGKFLSWPRLEQAVAILVLVSLGWLMVRTGE